MTNSGRRTLFWTPRVLAIVYIAFLSMFSLDAFGGGKSFWETLSALAIELIPCFVLIAILIVAWRWEWVGAASYAAAGVLYVVTVLPRPVSPITKLVWTLIVAGPAFLLAVLFLVNWLRHAELHSTQHKAAV